MKKLLTLLASMILLFSVLQAQNKQTEKDDPHARITYEFNMIKSPKTGEIPDNIRQKELKYVRSAASGLINLSKADATEWENRGPWNVGGRTRALAIDISNSNTILAAGVSGGLWKSNDQGSSWIKVNLPDIAHSGAITCIAQDPNNTQVWYYGTGEYSGNSASETGASYRGSGLYRSTDGGNTWAQVVDAGAIETFDSYYDYMWDIKVSPVTSTVFAATYGRIYKSTDGTTFEISFDSRTSSSSSRYTDVEISLDGTVYVCTSSDGDQSGIFKSSDDGQTYTDITPANFPTDYNRMVMAVAPSNPDKLFVLGHRDAQDANGHNLHLLWVYDNSTDTWTDLSDNIPMPNNLSGYFDSQGGYDLIVKVKPDNENVVFIGGTNLYRSTDGFTTTDNVVQVGGYTPSGDSYAKYTNHHPDQHSLAFDPDNSSVLYSGHDGGISKTEDCLDNTANADGETIVWTSLNNGYLTTQTYQLAVDMSATYPNLIVAGFQDNGTWLTTSTSPTTDWKKENSGDGAYAAVAKVSDGYFVFSSSQNGSTYLSKYDDTGNFLFWSRVNPDLSDPLFINPYVIDANNPDIIYMLDNAGLWRHTTITQIDQYSTSAPAGWENFSDLLASGYFSYLTTSTTPANILFLGTSDGKIYKVENANTSSTMDLTDITGDNFPLNAYVSSISVDPQDANKILISFSNYEVISIFYTDDGGQTWYDVSGNLEENPDGSGSGPSVRSVAIYSSDNFTKYYAGTSTGLYSTTYLDTENGTTTWTQEGPATIGNVLVDFVVTRPADSKIFVGSHGNGIFDNITSIVASTNPSTHLPGFDVYPNPSKGLFNVVLPEGQGKLIIRNSLGQTVMFGNFNGGKTSIDMQYLPEGNYYAQYYTGSKVYTAKLIIKK